MSSLLQILHILVLVQVYTHTEGQTELLPCDLRNRCDFHGLSFQTQIPLSDSSSATFSCSINVQGEIEITWWRSNDGALDNLCPGSDCTQIFPGLTPGIMFGSTMNIIQVSNVTAQAQGLYNCRVTPRGSQSQPFQPLGCLLIPARAIFTSCPDGSCNVTTIRVPLGGVADLDVRVNFTSGGGCANQEIRLMRVRREESNSQPDYVCSSLTEELAAAPCVDNDPFTVETVGSRKYDIRLQLKNFNESHVGTYNVIVELNSAGGTPRTDIRRTYRLELDDLSVTTTTDEGTMVTLSAESSSINTGLVVGGVIGGLFVLGLIALVIVVVFLLILKLTLWHGKTATTRDTKEEEKEFYQNSLVSLPSGYSTRNSTVYDPPPKLSDDKNSDANIV